MSSDRARTLATYRAMCYAWRRASSRHGPNLLPLGKGWPSLERRDTLLETMLVSENGKAVEFWYNDATDSTHLAVEVIQ